MPVSRAPGPGFPDGFTRPRRGCGGDIRITDIYGEQLTVQGIPVRADVVQAARVQFAVR